MRKLKIFLILAVLLIASYVVAGPQFSGGGGGGTGTSFSVTDITGQTDDTTPATTATAVLAQGGSLIESTLGQIATAINPTAATLHIDDTLTALGIASEATNFGTFTGSTIADNQTAKVALQSLETAVETKAPASGIALTALANQNAYTVNGNATAGAAAPTAIASSANMISLLGSADYSTARTNLGLAIGTNVQAQSATLLSLAGLTETNGGLAYGTADNAYAWLAAGAEGTLLMGNGAAAPSWLAAGTAGYFLIAAGAADPVWTSQPTLAALEALTLTQGGLLYSTAADTPAVLAKGTANQILGMNSGATAPEWKSTLSVSSIKLTGDLTGLAPSVIVLVPSGVATAVHEYILTHADDSSATNAYVGMTLYNVTTADSCTVTASTNTTITCAATATMGWDDDPAQSYQLGPGPDQSGSVFYVAGAGTIRHPATAGYTAGYVADGTNKLTIDMASDSMVLTATIGTTVTVLDAGDCIDSSDTTVDDYIVIHNKSATSAKGLGSRGTWADGGAS